MRSALFYDQFKALWWGIKRKRYRVPGGLGDEYVRLMAAGTKMPDIRSKHYMAYDGGTRSEVRRFRTSDERRVEFLVDVVGDQRRGQSDKLIAEALAPLRGSGAAGYRTGPLSWIFSENWFGAAYHTTTNCS